MMYLRWLRRRLGMDADMDFIAKKLNYHSSEMCADIISLSNAIGRLRRDVVVQNQALGRIIAKIDPAFVGSEVPATITDPITGKPKYDEAYQKRKEESDKLGAAAIDRLYSEQDARDKYNTEISPLSKDRNRGSQGTY